MLGYLMLLWYALLFIGLLGVVYGWIVILWAAVTP